MNTSNYDRKIREITLDWLKTSDNKETEALRHHAFLIIEEAERKATCLIQFAVHARRLIEARKKLLTLMGTGEAWDDQQAVVQSCVKQLTYSIIEAESAGLMPAPEE